jgi:hypothetical protein
VRSFILALMKMSRKSLSNLMSSDAHCGVNGGCQTLPHRKDGLAKFRQFVYSIRSRIEISWVETGQTQENRWNETFKNSHAGCTGRDIAAEAEGGSEVVLDAEGANSSILGSASRGGAPPPRCQARSRGGGGGH